MTRFANQFQMTAAKTHMRLNGESVVYCKSCGDELSRTALIERDPALLMQIIGEASEAAIVGLINDEDDGILSGDVNTDGDMIELAMQVGQCPQRRQVLKIISSNAGMTRLLVQ